MIQSTSLIFLMLFSSILAIEVSQDDYVRLPKVFDFNITDNCPVDHVHCRIVIQFMPIDKKNPPKVWNIMQQMKDDKRTYYRRDLVYRGGCVDQKNIQKEHKDHMRNGLIGKIKEMHCVGHLDFIENLDTVDIFVGLMMICYLIFVVFCTIKTYKTKESKEADDLNEMTNKYIRKFSMIYIWQTILETKPRGELKKFIIFQGMRTVSITLVILFHCFVAMMLSYSENPEYIEEFFIHPLKRVAIDFFGLAVQIFFIMSSWLLAAKLHVIIERNSKITLKDIFVLTMNRYFRLIPPVLVSVMITRSAAMGAFIQPLYHQVFEEDRQRCSVNWWRTILLLHTSGSGEHVCLSYTWYIVADTQMYISVCLLFYVSQKLRIPMKHLLQAVVAAAMCIQFHTVMTTKFDGLMRIKPRYIEGSTPSNASEFLVSYVRSINHLATYAIGFTFGTMHCKNGQKIIFDTSMKKIFWYVSFIGLPLISSIFHNFTSSRVIEAIMAIILRPMFGLGLAIGLLGMATGTGGYIRKFFQWIPFLFLGRFTYSIYSFHFAIVFGRMMTENMTKLSHIYYLKNAATNVTLSFIVGILMYTILEYPCMELQKMILPQVQTKRKTKDETK